MVASCLVLLKVVPGTSTAATTHVSVFVHQFILASICDMSHACYAFDEICVENLDIIWFFFFLWKEWHHLILYLLCSSNKIKFWQIWIKIIKAVFSNASVNGNLPMLCRVLFGSACYWEEALVCIKCMSGTRAMFSSLIHVNIYSFLLRVWNIESNWLVYYQVANMDKDLTLEISTLSYWL